MPRHQTSLQVSSRPRDCCAQWGDPAPDAVSLAPHHLQPFLGSFDYNRLCPGVRTSALHSQLPSTRQSRPRVRATLPRHLLCLHCICCFCQFFPIASFDASPSRLAEKGTLGRLLGRQQVSVKLLQTLYSHAHHHQTTQTSGIPMAASDKKTRTRADYAFILDYRTRWCVRPRSKPHETKRHHKAHTPRNDNDMYDHMNNSVYNFL